MHEKHTELVESLHRFPAIWELIGKPFLYVTAPTGRDWRSAGYAARCLYTIMNPTRGDWVKGVASVTLPAIGTGMSMNQESIPLLYPSRSPARILIRALDI